MIFQGIGLAPTELDASERPTEKVMFPERDISGKI